VYQIKQLYEDTQTLTVEDKSAVKVLFDLPSVVSYWSLTLS